MPKIAINKDIFFELSLPAAQEFARRKGFVIYGASAFMMSLQYWTVPQNERSANEEAADAGKMFFDFGKVPRDDPDLIAVIEQFGADAETENSELKIVDVPDDVKWHIASRYGTEWVAEDHRTWA